MIGLSQTELRRQITAKTDFITLSSEYAKLRPLVDRIVEGVVSAIIRNNAEIERRLDQALRLV